MTESNVIERKAMEIDGRVGSFYDGFTDRVVQQNKVKTNESLSHASVVCEIIRGDAHQGQHILKTLDIEQDLRINALLSSTTRKGRMTRLLDYRSPFDQHIRFLHYEYAHRFEDIENPRELPPIPQLTNKDDIPTHMITGVKWGIEILIVLQLPTDMEMINIIDERLKMMKSFLEKTTTNATFSLEDEELFNKNVQMDIYSNIPSVEKIDSFFTICQFINGRNDQLNLYRPLMYQLQSIKQLFPHHVNKEIDLSSLHCPSMDSLEDHLIELIQQRKQIDLSLDSLTNDEPLKGQLDKIRQKMINFNEVYKQRTTQFRDLINRIRCKESDTSELDKSVEDLIQWKQQNDLKMFLKEIKELEVKRDLINELRQQGFQYHDVMIVNIEQNNFTQILTEQLIKNPKNDRIFCANDTLKQKDPTGWKILRDQLTKERDHNPDTNLIYADFTYCSFELPSLTLLPIDEPRSCSSPKDEVINILLVGEIGVGKSTFVNAFVNYLAFDTLKKAEESERLVLIPVSFVMTIGDDFEEKEVHFRASDDLINEDFAHPGESVTQYCKSYLFTLNDPRRTKLRLIDTPGFGDTRGVEQDTINMQNILRYVTHFTHLNAICFLLIPYSSQVNNYLPTCLTQLLDVLGPDGHENIIFCFTNARSSFYTSGDTSAVLRKLLQSMPIPKIPFQKKNAFCFDNEAFRYLVALQNGIEFNDEGDKEDYERSWKISLKESHRLVNYVTNELHSRTLDHQPPSKIITRMKIDKMVRPMLETMRNNLRNIILKDQSIELIPIVIHRRASRCLQCPDKNPYRVGHFSIPFDDAHEILKSCLECECHSRQHLLSHYMLKYNLSRKLPNYNKQSLEERNKELLQLSAEFASFLKDETSLEAPDPFLWRLTQMINEEKRLCETPPSNPYNCQLEQMLKVLLRDYVRIIEKMKSDGRIIDAIHICQLMEKIREYPEIQVQTVATEGSEQAWLQVDELLVPEH